MILFVLFFMWRVDNCALVAAETQCITPNLEKANCVLLEACPLLFDGVKSLNDTVIDFARMSVCKMEGSTVHVCCGTLSYFINNTCANHNKEPGRCVKLAACPQIYSAIKSLNYEAITFAKKSICKGDDNNGLSVCCPVSPSTTPAPSLNVKATSTIRTTINTLSAVTPSYIQVFTKDIDFDGSSSPSTETNIIARQITTQPNTTKVMAASSTAKQIILQTTTKRPSKVALPDRRFCGLQNTDDRFYGNSDSAIDELPWIALIIHGNDTGYEQQNCLGILISSRYVLTTAICVNYTDAELGFKITSVRLGKYDTNSTTACVPSADFQECSEPVTTASVEKTIPHPNFKLDPQGIGHNIALIRLSKHISFSDHIKPICLPERNSSLKMGEILSTSGWGTTVWEENVEKKFKTKKRSAGVVVPLRRCIEASDINLESAINDKKHLCYRVESGDGPCLDDAGAPLMSSKSRQWQLEGISYVPVTQRCGKGALIVFLNMTSYVEWIENTIEP